MLATLCNTCARVSEITALHVGDVLLDRHAAVHQHDAHLTRKDTNMFMQDTGIPSPPVLVSTISPTFMLTFFGSFAAAAFVVAVALAVRHRDPLPVACCIGALICALNEPVYDVLGKIVYGENHPVAFTALGRDIPWFLVIGYVPAVGLLPYAISRWMAAGWSRARLHLIALGGLLSVVFVEVVNLYTKAWKYYGEVPLQFFGGVAAMATVPLVTGFLLYTLTGPLRGWRRVLAGLVIPTLGLPMMFASTGWPLYIALYTNLPPVLDYAAVALLLLLITATVYATTALADGWRRGEVANAVREQIGRPSMVSTRDGIA